MSAYINLGFVNFFFLLSISFERREDDEEEEENIKTDTNNWFTTMTGGVEVKELQFRSETSTTFHLYLCGVFLHSKCLSSCERFSSATLSAPRLSRTQMCWSISRARRFSLCSDFSLHDFALRSRARDKSFRGNFSISLWMDANCYYRRSCCARPSI